MADAVSVSVSEDAPAERHSKREYVPLSADRSLSDWNVSYVANDYRDTFNAMFGDAITRYNAKQKRADRLKGYDLYGELMAKGMAKGRDKFIASHVIAIGNAKTMGLTDEDFDADAWRLLRSPYVDGEKAKGRKSAEQYDADTEAASRMVAEPLRMDSASVDMRKRTERVYARIVERVKNELPNVKIASATAHFDEPCGAPHLDLNIFPHAGADAPRFSEVQDRPRHATIFQQSDGGNGVPQAQRPARLLGDAMV